MTPALATPPSLGTLVNTMYVFVFSAGYVHEPLQRFFDVVAALLLRDRAGERLLGADLALRRALLDRLVGAQPDVRRMTEDSARRPARKADLAHHVGPHPRRRLRGARWRVDG